MLFSRWSDPMTATATASVLSHRFATAPTGVGPAVEDMLAVLDRIGTVISLRRDAALFVAGDPVRCCFKVITGTMRSCRILAQGRRHVGEFMLPGDFIGLEMGERWNFTVEAVSDATLMRYPRLRVGQLLQQQPRLGKRLLDLIGRELSAAQTQMLMLGRKTAVERLASFLLTMSVRTGKADRVWLPMTRHDIADHLGLTIETVSRVFSLLKSRGVIQLKTSSEVVLKSRGALAQLAE
jgi:CRP/FNR family transcriptional regulator